MLAYVWGQASLTLVEEKSLMWISTEFCVYSAQSQASIPLVQQGSMCQAIPLPEISTWLNTPFHWRMAMDQEPIPFRDDGANLASIL